MKLSIVVCTYNAPRELDFALAGLATQTRPPDEVWIADDGSTDETRQVIDSWREQLPFPVGHARHEDKGFRKARIVNEAVRRSTGDQLLFLDGDSFPHSRWAADHEQAAKPGRVLCGRRVKLGPDLSQRMTRDWILDGRLEGVFGPVFRSSLRRDSQRYLLGLRLPAGLARCFHPRPRKLMGVNFSLPRELYEQVNGYDEEWRFYGHEDRDLELRLVRSGFERFPLLNRAVVYHVHHPARPIGEDTRSLLREQERSERTRCEVGLVSSVPFDPAT